MEGYLFDRAAWTWGLLLIALTVATHATAVVGMALAGVQLRFRLEERRPARRVVIPIVMGVVCAVGMLLALLHATEAAIWATAYLCLGALRSPTDAILYSLGAITTAGAPGSISPEGHWRIVGALESVDGGLLFGISTAYLFAVLQMYWPMLSHRQRS